MMTLSISELLANAFGRTSSSTRTLVSVVIVVVLVGAVWALRRRATSGAARLRQVPPPMVAFDEPGGLVGGPFQAKYLGTTQSGDWLDRIKLHDLSVAGPVSVAAFGAGLLFTRVGAVDLAIPCSSIAGVRRANGLAGKTFDTNGVVVVSWRLGRNLVDTGVRVEAEADRVALVQTVRRLIGGHSGFEEGS